MQTCRHHPDRNSTRVCSVCGGYFCDECVSVRYYPRESDICHHCSGEKPYEPPPEQEQLEEAPTPQRRIPLPLPKLDGESLLPRVEWVVFLACAVIIVYRLAVVLGNSETELVWSPESPDDMAVHCLGKLGRMKRTGVSPSINAIESACPPPFMVELVDNYVIIRSPDADRFGFSEAEMTLNPVALAVVE